jgi:N-sulfoglucosamine sulfohydrolase
MSKHTRRSFLKAAGVGALSLAGSRLASAGKTPKSRPNILLAISDDQSWPHASAYGCNFVKTPAFDRVAREGVLFHNAFTPAPQCSPTRAAILTGRNPWQNGDAAVHGTPLPGSIPIYTRLLEKAGYHVGMTGKGWAPGPVKGHNPAGKNYGSKGTRFKYTGAFRTFLAARRPGQPFCFWYGSKEPHRGYIRGSGLKAGKTLDSVVVPRFLPDHRSIRSDFLDYAVEIEQFDTQLGQMLEILEKGGELDNTLVVVTSDNGMAWSRAKANIYEYGVHMPLAIRWGNQVPGKRNVTDLVSLIDLAPSFLQAAGEAIPKGMSGRSLLSILKSNKSGLVDASRDSVLLGQERHTPYVRANDVGYPCRAIRTDRYLYIRNLKPDRWPEGDTFFGGGSSSSRALYIAQCDNPNIQRYIRLAWAQRPAEELYDIKADPDCIKNLAGNSKHAQGQKTLRDKLNSILREQGDPRIAGDDRYDEQEYFKADYWKEARLKYLKEVEKVHKVMESAGWEHGRVIGPLRQPEANK